MLNAGLAKAQTHDLASVTSAMNAAATQDLRSVGADADVLDELLRRPRRRRAPRAAAHARAC